MSALNISLSVEVLACVFHILALYKQLTRGVCSRKGKLPVLPVSVHLLQQPGDIWRPWKCVQTQQVAVDIERESGQREISSCLQQGNSSVCGPGFHKVPGALRAASFLLAGRGNNTKSGERDRAEVSGGSSHKNCSLAELIVC